MDKVGGNKLNQTTKFGKIGEYENNLPIKTFISPQYLYFLIFLLNSLTYSLPAL